MMPEVEQMPKRGHHASAPPAGGERRRRRRRRGRRWSVELLGLAVVATLLGLALYRLFAIPWILVLPMGGLLLFVLVAWWEARPGQGGAVGHPDINPWTLGH